MSNELIIPRHMIDKYNHYSDFSFRLFKDILNGYSYFKNIAIFNIDDDVIINHHIYSINVNNNIKAVVEKAFMELNTVRYLLGRTWIYVHVSELCFKVACQRIIKKLLN